jgi:hypothetical protein
MSPQRSSSPARSATCATSTSASPSAPPPRPPPSTRSTAHCQTRIAVAARKLGLIKADIAVALSLSLTHKAVGFDRRMPEIDFDALSLPETERCPSASWAPRVKAAPAIGSSQGGSALAQRPPLELRGDLGETPRSLPPIGEGS